MSATLSGKDDRQRTKADDLETNEERNGGEGRVLTVGGEHNVQEEKAQENAGIDDERFQHVIAKRHSYVNSQEVTEKS